MLLLALSCALLGTWLGTRLQVLVLVPILMLIFTGITIAGIISGGSLWPIAAAAALGSTSVQLGYLAGAVWKAIEPLKIRSGRVEGLHK
jgi:hypothetical protein